MTFEIPKDIKKEVDVEKTADFFTPKMKLRDLSYGEIEKMQQEDPGLYEQLVEEQMKELERKHNQEIPSSTIDDSDLDRLYQKEKNDIYHQN